MSDFQTYLQQLPDGNHLQNWLFSKCVVFEQFFFSDEFQNFFHRNFSEKTENIKADQYIWISNIYRFKKLQKLSEIFYSSFGLANQYIWLCNI